MQKLTSCTEKHATLLFSYNSLMLPQFNYCSLMFCNKISYRKIERIQKKYLREVYNEPHISLEELLIMKKILVSIANT